MPDCELPMEVSTTPEGWLILTGSAAIEQQALAIRERRDREFDNIYAVADTDLRWVGEVGELLFYQWLQGVAQGAGRWLRRAPAGKPDFIVHGHRVGLKTVKRKVPFAPEYTAQITARHVTENVDHFVFASYQSPTRKLWLVGGIPRDEFRERARYHAAGDRVHEHYTVRRGHEIYNVDSCHLTPPLRWLERLAASPGPHGGG